MGFLSCKAKGMGLLEKPNLTEESRRGSWGNSSWP